MSEVETAEKIIDEFNGCIDKVTINWSMKYKTGEYGLDELMSDLENMKNMLDNLTSNDKEVTELIISKLNAVDFVINGLNNLTCDDENYDESNIKEEVDRILLELE